MQPVTVGLSSDMLLRGCAPCVAMLSRFVLMIYLLRLLSHTPQGTLHTCCRVAYACNCACHTHVLTRCYVHSLLMRTIGEKVHHVEETWAAKP